MFFSVVIGGDTLTKKKPDPMGLSHIAKEFKCEPAEILMVSSPSYLFNGVFTVRVGVRLVTVRMTSSPHRTVAHTVVA